MNDNQPVRPFRPSNGTEGDIFTHHWCHHCERDRAFREAEAAGEIAEGCPILANTMAYDIDHPSYPKEWIYGTDREPKCTAYTEDPATPLRCENTIDMFSKER